MLISKVIYEDEVNDHVRIKYPCFELRDIVEYYFEIIKTGKKQIKKEEFLLFIL